MKYVRHKHPRVSDLHKKLTSAFFCCKIQMPLCSLSVYRFFFMAYFFWKKSAISFQILKSWRTCFEQGVTDRNTTGVVQKTMSKPTFFFHHVVHIWLPPCCYSPFILFSHLFILLHGYLPSACLSSAAGVPRENKPTAAGMKYHNHLPLPPPFPPPLCLPPPVPPCPCLYAPPVCLMSWLLIRPEAPQCPAPGASTSLSYKFSRAVSQME